MAIELRWLWSRGNSDRGIDENILGARCGHSLRGQYRAAILHALRWSRDSSFSSVKLGGGGDMGRAHATPWSSTRLAQSQRGSTGGPVRNGSIAASTPRSVARRPDPLCDGIRCTRRKIRWVTISPVTSGRLVTAIATILESKTAAAITATAQQRRWVTGRQRTPRDEGLSPSSNGSLRR